MRASSSSAAPVTMRCKGFSIRGSLAVPELTPAPHKILLRSSKIGRQLSSRGARALLRRRAQLLQRGAQQSLKRFRRATLARAFDGLLRSMLIVAEIEQRGHDVRGSAGCHN